MKKFYFAAMMAVLSIALFSCSKGDEAESAIESYARNFFSAEKAEFKNEAVPEPTITQPIQASMNDMVLAGGQNFINITSPVELEKVIVSMSGQDGYWEVPVTPTRAEITYTVVLDMGADLSQNMNLQISGVTPNGDVTPAVTCSVKYVESLSGDLAINLTFSNEKDVDLHVVTPFDFHIFYGNTGVINYVEYQKKYKELREDPNFDWNGFNEEEFYKQFLMFGLDHDSNAGCDIDGLNNENIVFNENFVCDGKYTIYLDMYQNCNTSSEPTKWGVSARYQGNLINSGISVGTNPASGEFPGDEPSNFGGSDISRLKYKVLEFELTGTGRTADDVKKAIKEATENVDEKSEEYYGPARRPLSSAEKKLELSRTMNMLK